MRHNSPRRQDGLAGVRTHATIAARRRYAPIFAALGDETRLAIITALTSGDSRSIVELTEGTKVTRQAVTKHLRVLENARLVRSRRVGRSTLFELDPAPMREVREYVDVVSRHWDAALTRLKAFVEDDS
jgi:DNA-binding transcriptional ArsR family regulator